MRNFKTTILACALIAAMCAGFTGCGASTTSNTSQTSGTDSAAASQTASEVSAEESKTVVFSFEDMKSADEKTSELAEYEKNTTMDITVTMMGTDNDVKTESVLLVKDGTFLLTTETAGATSVIYFEDGFMYTEDATGKYKFETDIATALSQSEIAPDFDEDSISEPSATEEDGVVYYSMTVNGEALNEVLSANPSFAEMFSSGDVTISDAEVKIGVKDSYKISEEITFDISVSMSIPGLVTDEESADESTAALEMFMSMKMTSTYDKLGEGVTITAPEGLDEYTVIE